MAINRNPKNTTEAPPAVASMNPDNFVSAGLMDDFDGLVTKVRLVPWDYNGNIDHHVLGVAVTIKPEDGDEFVQTYSCGELDQFVPSMDGRTPVDLENGQGEELEGIFALKVGKKDGLNNNTNWAHFIGALIDAGFDKSKLTASVDFLEGTFGHWNRVPQKKRSGITVNRGPEDQSKQRNNDILVITELKAAPASTGKASAKPAAKSAPSKPAPAKTQAAPAATNGAGESLDDRLAAAVTEAVLASDEGLPKSKLAKVAIDNFSGPEKAKAIKRVQEADFLNSSDTWTFDVESATLYSNA